MSPSRRPPPTLWPRVVQLATLLGGLVGMWNETFRADEPRTLLVAAFLAMMGVPAGLAFDRRLRSPLAPPEDSPPPPPSSSPGTGIEGTATGGSSSLGGGIGP